MQDAIRLFPERMKAIRTGLGLTQELFLPVVRESSRAVLGAGVRKYSQSTLSRLESGKQPPRLEDVAVIAACDPRGPNMLWLGWGLDSKPHKTLPQGAAPVAQLGKSDTPSGSGTAQKRPTKRTT